LLLVPPGRELFGENGIPIRQRRARAGLDGDSPVWSAWLPRRAATQFAYPGSRLAVTSTARAVRGPAGLRGSAQTAGADDSRRRV